jgi:hypothetical protein
MKQWTVDDVMTTKAVTVSPDTPYPTSPRAYGSTFRRVW